MDEATKGALAHGAKALEDVTDLVHKLLGPAAEEFGLLLGDKARLYRMKNLAKILRRMKEILAEAGTEPTVVPPRLSIPALEAASVEDDEILQEKWAALLANAANAGHRTPVLPSFVEVLKELTPEAATLLDHVYDYTRRDQLLKFDFREMGLRIGELSILKQLFLGDDPRMSVYADLSAEDVDYLSLITADLIRLGTLWRTEPEDSINSEGRNAIEYFLTPFGNAFVSACRKPEGAAVDRSITKPIR